jgi:hypothetical protein
MVTICTTSFKAKEIKTVPLQATQALRVEYQHSVICVLMKYYIFMFFDDSEIKKDYFANNFS